MELHKDLRVPTEDCAPSEPPRNHRVRLFGHVFALFHRLPRRAQGLVELALVVPSAMLILLGTADLGRAFYEAEAVHQAVMSGALEAMNFTHVNDCPSPCSNPQAPCFSDTGVTCANDVVICAMTNALPWLPGGDCRTPNADDTIQLGSGTWVAGDWDPGDAFTITMNHTFHYITPFLSSTKTLTLTSTITSRRHIQ